MLQASLSWASQDQSLPCTGISEACSRLQDVLVGSPSNLTQSLTEGDDDIYTHLTWGHCWKDSAPYTGSHCPSSKSVEINTQQQTLTVQEG